MSMQLQQWAAVRSAEQTFRWTGQPWKNESYALKMYPMSYNLRVPSKCLKQQGFLTMELDGISLSSFVCCPSYVIPLCKLNSCLWFCQYLHQHALDRAARLLYMKQLPVSSLSLNSWIHKCSYVSNQFAFEHQVGEYHLVRTVCEDPSGTTSWAQLHILWACLCSSQVAHGLCEVPSMKVLTRGRMKEHWWGSFHDLSRLLAFYSLLRWPQTPCQPHMACACHVAP